MAEPFKVVVLGKPSVGKTALVVRFICKRFIWNYDPTLENTYKHQVVVDDELHTVEVLDTAGCWEDEEQCRWDGSIRWGEAFVIVYDVTDRQSFEAARSLRERIYELRRNGVGIAFVGNKTDLDHLRAVPSADGERAAVELSCSFHELSACVGGAAVDNVFVELCRDAAARRSAVGSVGMGGGGGGRSGCRNSIIEVVAPKMRRRSSAQLFFSKFLPGQKKPSP